jgi:glycosyltransferase involved in cell wall biosynthesis
MPVFGTFAALTPRQQWWRRPLRHFALRLSSGLAICAGWELRRVTERYALPERKLARIYFPVDLSVWHPSSKREMRALLGLPLDASIVVYHGAMSLQVKGLDVLVDAWEQLCQDHPDRQLRLMMIGTGGDAQELSNLLAAKRLRGVEWLNQWVHDRNVLRRYLSAADVYAFPSRVDAFGIAVIEAMACGLPIVAASAPGIRDILEDGEHSGGLVVPTGDVKALASAIKCVLNDADLALKLAKNARRRAESAFSMEVIGNQLGHFLTTSNV